MISLKYVQAAFCDCYSIGIIKALKPLIQAYIAVLEQSSLLIISEYEVVFENGFQQYQNRDKLKCWSEVRGNY